MASCGGGACGSGCQRADDGAGPAEYVAPVGSKVTVAGGERRCSKCGGESGGEGRVFNGMCADCFRAHLFGKFKLAVTTNAMISPVDKVLVAFSGGPASRVALQFIHEMQCKSLKSWDASQSQALPVFTVGVAFINESVLCTETSTEIDSEIDEIRSMVSGLFPAHKELHIAPIESICSVGSDDGKSRLNQLLNSIVDETGKEDLLMQLRMLSLQKIALDNGYSKLVLGSCSSAIACHVLSATVKGQGYALPADVQYVDARRHIPVVLPLRDCLADELSMLCALDGLKTQQLLQRPSTGINRLVSSFVARLREENPSRERTIVRTAEKLRPFTFNKFMDDSYHDFLPSRLRSRFKNVDNGESAFSEVLCLICSSPLCDYELEKLRSVQDKAKKQDEIYTMRCCQSCSFQILPKDDNSLDHFYSALPQPMVEKVKSSMHSLLRKQIEDCLLDDDDEC